MACPQCGAESIDGATGLCEPHFEAQRDAIRVKLSAGGGIPVAKLFSAKANESDSVAGKKPVGVSSALIAALVFFGAVFFYAGRDSEVSPLSFRDASPGEAWQINSADVVMVNQPRVAPSSIEFAATLVTGVPSGTTVMVLGGSRSDPWKYVVVEKGGVGLQGYILSETVPSARKTN